MSLFEMFDDDVDGDDDVLFAPSTTEYPIGCSVKIAADRLRSANVPSWLRDQFATMPAVAKGTILRHSGDFSYVSWSVEHAQGTCNSSSSSSNSGQCRVGTAAAIQIAATIHRGYLSSPQARMRPGDDETGSVQLPPLCSASSQPLSTSCSTCRGACCCCSAAGTGESTPPCREGIDVAVKTSVGSSSQHHHHQHLDPTGGRSTPPPPASAATQQSSSSTTLSSSAAGGGGGRTTRSGSESSSSEHSHAMSNASSSASSSSVPTVIATIRTLREGGNTALASSNVDDALVKFTDALRQIPCQVFAFSQNGSAAHRAAHYTKNCRRCTAFPSVTTSSSAATATTAQSSSATTSGRTTPQLNDKQIDEMRQECCYLLVNRSALYLSQKNPKAAARDAIAAVQLHPQSKRALIAQVNSTSALNLHQYAIAALRELNTLEPSTETKVALGRSMLSAFFQEKGARVCCTVASPQQNLRLYARANCMPGEVLFTERPFLVAVLQLDGNDDGSSEEDVVAAASVDRSSKSASSPPDCCAHCCSMVTAAATRITSECCSAVYCSVDCKASDVGAHAFLCRGTGRWSRALDAIERHIISLDSCNNNSHSNNRAPASHQKMASINAAKMRFATRFAISVAARRRSAASASSSSIAAVAAPADSSSSSSPSTLLSVTAVPLVSSFSNAVSCSSRHLQQIVLGDDQQEEQQQQRLGAHATAAVSATPSSSSSSSSSAPPPLIVLEEQLRRTVSERNDRFCCFGPLRQWLGELKLVHDALPHGTMSFETLLRFVAMILGCAVELPFRDDGVGDSSKSTISGASRSQKSATRTCLACFTLAGNLSRQPARSTASLWWSGAAGSLSKLSTEERGASSSSSSLSPAGVTTADRAHEDAGMSRLVELRPTGDCGQIESTSTEVRIVCRERVSPGVWLAL